ncbi:hypothetical protein D9M71_700420 [compost metagenome]
MKGISILLTMMWGALLGALALDSYGIDQGSWFEPMGLGFLTDFWRVLSDYVDQYMWGSTALYLFWLGSSLLMFRPAVLERFISRKNVSHG